METNFFSVTRSNSDKDNNFGNKDYPRIFADKSITPVFLNTTTVVRGYIMPDFDRSMSKNDVDFRTSVGSYRISNMEDPETGHPIFSAWVQRNIKAYLFYLHRYNFISPTMVGLHDPIVDLRKYIYGNKLEPYMWLVKNPGQKSDTPFVLPNTSMIAAMNAVCNPTYTGRDGKDTDVKPRVLVLKSAAYNNMESALNADNPSTVAPIDENWPGYKYGDITDPKHAVNFVSCKYLMDTGNGIQYAGLKFGTDTRSMGKIVDLGITTSEIPEEYLAERVDLEDPDTYHIPSYQDILDLIIDTGAVDSDLLEDACGDYGEIHDPSTKTYPSAGVESDNEVAPEPPTVSDEVPPPPPVAVEKEKEYWVAMNGKTVKQTESQVQQLVDDDACDIYVMAIGDNKWQTPEYYGFTKDEIPGLTPPPPVENSFVKPAPLNHQPDDPNAERRTKEEEEEITELRASIAVNGASVSINDLKRLGALQRKLPYVG